MKAKKFANPRTRELHGPGSIQNLHKPYLLSFIGDGQVGDSQIGFLGQELSNHPVPRVSLGIVAAVGPVSHDVNGVVEAQDLGDLLDQVDVVALVSGEGERLNNLGRDWLSEWSTK